jgi:hypothetical protein
MGGSITVDSLLEQGSVFTTGLSLLAFTYKNRDDEHKAKAAVLLLSDEDKLKDCLVILTDDNGVNREVLKGYLNHWGFSFHSFESALAVLDFLNNHSGINPNVSITHS